VKSEHSEFEANDLPRHSARAATFVGFTASTTGRLMHRTSNSTFEAPGYWFVSRLCLYIVIQLCVTTGVHGLWSIAIYLPIKLTSSYPAPEVLCVVLYTRMCQCWLPGRWASEQWKVGGTCYSYSSTWDWNYQWERQGECASMWANQGRQSDWQTSCVVHSGAMCLN